LGTRLEGGLEIVVNIGRRERGVPTALVRRLVQAPHDLHVSPATSPAGYPARTDATVSVEFVTASAARPAPTPTVSSESPVMTGTRGENEDMTTAAKKLLYEDTHPIRISSFEV
jgi:hypothetical protein